MEKLDIDTAGLNWHRQSEGEYVDRDGFNCISILHDTDFSGNPIACVLFSGLPVLVVECDDSFEYDHSFPEFASNYHQQTYAAFLEEIGEASEGASLLVCENGMDALWESDLVGEGHELISFVGRIAHALARENDYPEPKGF